MPELVARGLVVDRAHPGRSGGRTRALDGVDLVVEAGELLVVMGESGSGKSTLALALAGVVQPNGGYVEPPATGDVRLVLQRPEANFLEARVLDEVSLVARRLGEPTGHAERRAREVLSELGLPPDIAERDPLALSGGEQRRVAIAAVLAGDPSVTILDEPGAGLDAAARRELHDALARLHAAGRTIVMVTHDPAEASRLATRLVVLREGRVAWDGPATHVLGDPARADALGLDVATEVRILHAVAVGRRVGLTTLPTSPEHAIELLAAITAAPRGAASRTIEERGAAPPASPPVAVPPLPPLVDARVRILACAFAVAAALLAESLVAAGLVVVAAGLVVAAARLDRARVRLAVRPLIALTVLLVALQVLVGGDADVELVRGTTVEVPALAAMLRALQASGVVLATLALSGATAVGDLAAGLRWLLAPLRLLRVPIGSYAFVVATGIGLVPALADELERLRMAQRARGLRARSAGPVRRLRDDAALLAPLFVAAFRRAHLLADALAVRGIDPRASVRSWRPRTVPAVDLALLAGGVALLAVARLA